MRKFTVIYKDYCDDEMRSAVVSAISPKDAFQAFLNGTDDDDDVAPFIAIEGEPSVAFHESGIPA